jgi:gamma-glutamylputrescine oxidase
VILCVSVSGGRWRHAQERSRSPGYAGGIRFTGTYGVNPVLCLQGFKDVLIDNGMLVFESTEMTRLEGHTAFTRIDPS